ncbi:MAG: hypothetical protein A3C47_04915 [Omnitrophica bacterium RIFCSPHIGHO2_02_FULL_51_18]|nr:MAG: hypothetical protein A3C47_04915 [Omnitrophica bacterium RIFCSPHIGHO2_02_FULL_51_18]
MISGRNIVLVGFMGTGKTSVGKALAKKLGRSLVDIDRRIEDREKRKIKEIFEKEGEPYFRKLEKEVIREVSGEKRIVITTGGGAVLDSENISALKKNGILVCLVAAPETIYRRVKNSENRPLLEAGDKLTEIKRLLSAREPCYRAADYQLRTDAQRPEQTAADILKLLEDRPE